MRERARFWEAQGGRNCSFQARGSSRFDMLRVAPSLRFAFASSVIDLPNERVTRLKTANSPVEEWALGGLRHQAQGLDKATRRAEPTSTSTSPSCLSKGLKLHQFVSNAK